jgi:hypothetical protein
VPLSKIQSDILLLLAAHRNPESYVAGAVPLNRDGPRYSADIDIFHDREESVAAAAEADAKLLVKQAFAVAWLRREPGIHGAVVEREGKHTRLEWLRDSDFRFFPTVPDPVFGYVLHVIDIATNKALAAAGRRATCLISLRSTTGMCRWARSSGPRSPRTRDLRQRVSSGKFAAMPAFGRTIMPILHSPSRLRRGRSHGACA